MPDSLSDKPLKKWYTAGGGIFSIPLVVVGVVLLVILAAAGVRLTTAVADAPYLQGDMQTIQIGFALVSVLLSLVLLEAPVFTFVTIGQAKRIQLIKGYFSASVIVRYFDQFWSSRDGISQLVDRWKSNGRQLDLALKEDLHDKFDELLHESFGLHIYIIPAVLMTAIAGIVMFFGFYGGIALALTVAQDDPTQTKYPLGIKIDLVSIAAIFGAYTWIASDSITRNYQSALHPSDLLWYALRLVVAVPLGEAISMLTLSKDAQLINASSSGAVLAFVISMFSFDRISQILGSIANKALNTQAGTPAERDDLVIKLPGVDETTANRLIAEGFSTVAQMGAADPIRASIRAGLQFDFVLSLIDAALLWNYVGSRLDTLRTYGFKGASSILLYNEYVLSRDAPADKLIDDYKAANDAFKAATTAIDAARAALQGAQAAFLGAANMKNKAANALIAAQNDKNSGVAGADAAVVAATETKLAAESDLLAVKATLDTAAANAASCDDSHVGAMKRLADARAALVGPGTLLADAAKKAGMDESALRNVVQQVVKDEYAEFIRRMMWAIPA